MKNHTEVVNFDGCRLLLKKISGTVFCLLIYAHQNLFTMLRWTLIFLIVAIIAGVFGFTGIAAGAATIAKVVFFIFIVLFLVSLVRGKSVKGTL